MKHFYEFNNFEKKITEIFSSAKIDQEKIKNTFNFNDLMLDGLSRRFDTGQFFLYEDELDYLMTDACGSKYGFFGENEDCEWVTDCGQLFLKNKKSIEQKKNKELENRYSYLGLKFVEYVNNYYCFNNLQNDLLAYKNKDLKHFINQINSTWDLITYINLLSFFTKNEFETEYTENLSSFSSKDDLIEGLFCLYDEIIDAEDSFEVKEIELLYNALKNNLSKLIVLSNDKGIHFSFSIFTEQFTGEDFNSLVVDLEKSIRKEFFLIAC